MFPFDDVIMNYFVWNGRDPNLVVIASADVVAQNAARPLATTVAGQLFIQQLVGINRTKNQYSVFAGPFLLDESTRDLWFPS